jgi:hypothetical protein
VDDILRRVRMVASLVLVLAASQVSTAFAMDPIPCTCEQYNQAVADAAYDCAEQYGECAQIAYCFYSPAEDTFTFLAYCYPVPPGGCTYAPCA